MTTCEYFARRQSERLAQEVRAELMRCYYGVYEKDIFDLRDEWENYKCFGLFSKKVTP
jgi:hypothetical protein